MRLSGQLKSPAPPTREAISRRAHQIALDEMKRQNKLPSFSDRVKNGLRRAIRLSSDFDSFVPQRCGDSLRVLFTADESFIFSGSLNLKLVPPLMLRERRETCPVRHNKPGNQTAGDWRWPLKRKAALKMGVRLSERGPDALPVLNGEMSVEVPMKTASSESGAINALQKLPVKTGAFCPNPEPKQ